MQDSAATTADAYFPASQTLQLEDAEELKEPASQTAHNVAPVAELYRPAMQSVQVSAAEVDEYFPVPQGRQLVNPKKLNEPGKQSSHAAIVVPLDGLCLPTGHE